MSNANRRTHLRYRDPCNPTLHLRVGDGKVDKPLTGLIVNESKTGLSCVYVGGPLEVNSEIVWQETLHIGTPCKVVRCRKLDTDVFLLGLQIVG